MRCAGGLDERRHLAAQVPARPEEQRHDADVAVAAGDLLRHGLAEAGRHELEEREHRIALRGGSVDGGQHGLERRGPAGVARPVGEQDQGGSVHPAIMAPRTIVDLVPAMLPLFRLPPEHQRRWLAERLARPAPASAVGLSDGFRLPGREDRSTPAAVLVPLVNRPAGLTLLLTQRSATLPDHPGQISFPGGRVDPEDASDEAAALREAEEEVGLPPACVTLLGRLASYQTVTGFSVTPVVGWVEPPFDLRPDPVEVADVFEVPLAFVLEPAHQQRHFRMLGERRRDFYAIPYGDRYIWGATAAMLVILDRTLREG